MNKVRKTVLLALVSTVASALAGIAIASYLTVPSIPLMSEGDRLLVFDPEIGATANPSSHARRIYPAVRDRQTFAFDIYTDDRGARVDGPGQRSPERVDVLAIGDSFTWGYALANEDTYARHLSREFDASVSNFAMAAYGTTQSLQILRRNSDLAPKLVVYGIIAHHFERNVMPCLPSYYPFCFDASHVTWNDAGEPLIAPPQSNGVRRFQRHLAGDFSNPMTWLTHGVDVIRGRIEYGRAAYSAPSDAKKEEALAFLLREMGRSANKIGAELLVVYLPTNYYSAPEALQRVIGDIRLLDLTGAFQREKAKGANLYIVGDGHPNQAAHELISQEIAKYVRDNGLL
ncbi:MAG: hydrolase family protein [Reyranella sp.]|nr:hydrolase family protein [Reyranella sp.]